MKENAKKALSTAIYVRVSTDVQTTYGHKKSATKKRNWAIPRSFAYFFASSAAVTPIKSGNSPT